MGSSNSMTSSETSVHDIYNLPSLKMVGDQSWRTNARCRGLDVDLFFPRKEDVCAGHLMVASSRLICAGCPVRRECLQFAVDNVITHGMYGGTMPKDRRLGSMKFPNGDMPFTRVLADFKRAYSLTMNKPVPAEMYQELARAINKPLSEVKEMMKAPDTVVLKSGS